MAFTVEDGTGITGANSYATVAELDAYSEFRLDINAYTTIQKQSALVVASVDWVDGEHDMRYLPLTETQGLKLPDTYHDGIPQRFKDAVMKAALLQLQGYLKVDLATISTDGEIESESKSLGDLKKSVTYRRGSTQRYFRVLPPDLERSLQPYINGGGLGAVYRV